MLVKNYYTLLSQKQQDDGSFETQIQLRKDCEVYQGHFPEKPVCPGVCNIQMVLECAEQALQKRVRLTYLQQVKMLTLLNPTDYEKVTVRLVFKDQTEETVRLMGTIESDPKVHLELKAELTFC